MNSETTNAELENELFDVRRDARESQVAMASSLDALREKLAELTRRLEVSDAKALAAERALQESDCANSETSIWNSISASTPLSAKYLRVRLTTSVAIRFPCKSSTVLISEVSGTAKTQ